jgi:hypothetical protein
MSKAFVETKWGRYYPSHLRRIKEEHAKAVTAGAESFTVDGAEFLTRFGGYLIEFLEGEGLKA